MHALEDEPEKKNRGRRMGVGLVLAGALGASLLFGAQHIAPARRFMPEILQIAVVDDTTPPPPPENIPPPPPPPPPPKPKKEAPPPEEKPVEQAEPEQAEQQLEPSEPTAGLDSTSFGAGGPGGVSFRTGNTQMGDPNRPAGPPKVIEPPKVSQKAPQLVPARAIDPELPEYPERARKLNIQGAVLLEAEIDERGKIKNLRVRQGLERGLDEIAMASVKRWEFSPAMLAGHAVASTRLVRIRFELD